MYKLVEKNNHNHVHAIFDTKERADIHLERNVPFYCQNGYFMDKSLTADSFEIIDDGESK